MPFAAQVKGAILELDVRVREKRRYSFALQLGFSSSDNSARQRIALLAGSGARRADGTPVDTGLPIPLELSIQLLRSQVETPVYKKRVSEFELKAYGASYYSKEIDRVWLEPGDYHIRVEALQDIAELQGTPVKLEISYRRK